MALKAPPRHCIPDIGKHALGLADDRPDELQSFACGMTGRCAEVPEPQTCELQGTVPQWLQGDLYRNGPGTWDFRTKSGEVFSMGHWFDGLAVIHKFQISENGVTYRNQHLVKDMENYILENNRPPSLTIYNDPCSSYLGRAFSTFYQAVTQGMNSFDHYEDPVTGKEGKINVSVTVGPYRGHKLVSRTDANVLFELNPSNMQVIQQTNYNAALPELKGQLGTSHVERDEAAGLTFNVVWDLTATGGAYTLFCIPDDEAQEPFLLAKIQDEACYVHSFASTENYLILVLAPCVLQPLKMLINKNLFKDAQWKPQNGVKFYVVDKRKNGPGHIATYRHDAFFFFHNINASESEEGDICVDLSAYENIQIIIQLHRANLLYKHLDKIQPAIPRRYTLSNVKAAAAAGKTKVAEATSRDLLTEPQCFDLFSVNPQNKARAYRYAYGTSHKPGDSFFTRLLKMDAHTGSVEEWAEEGTYPGEPIFVPQPGATAEDQGVVLSVVLAGVQKRSFLLMLDASNMKEIARAWTQHPVTLGFHGNFLPLDAFKGSVPQSAKA